MNMQTHDLTALPIFCELNEEAAASICKSLITLNFSPGQNILVEGKSIQALWIILEGHCEVSRSCHVNEKRTLARLEPGDVFGEMSFVRTAPHSASIKAVTDVTVCCYQRSDFLELLAAQPKAAWQVTSKIADILAERLRRMDTWVCDIMDRPADDDGNGSGENQDRRNEWESFRSAVYTNWNF